MNIMSNTPIYVDNGAGTTGNGRTFQIDACLTGNGSIEYHDFNASMSGGLDITCPTNTYTGTWNIVQGPLLGAGTKSLVTNSVSIGANGALETLYNINSPKATLTLNGVMYLHQNDTFYQMAVNGTGIPAGVYSSAQLTAAFPTNFPASWNSIYGSTSNTASGSITVLNSLITPPVITSQLPAQSEEFTGAEMNYSVATSGNQATYQWFFNGIAVAGATNASFAFTSVAGTNTYYCVVSNSAGVASTIIQTNVAMIPSPVVTFDDDFNWTLQGVATTPSLSADVLTLTDNGAGEAAGAFYNIAQYVEGFNASFTYTPGGNLAADGITFCIQNSLLGPAALGGNGGNLGYFGINHSVAFELNIYALATGGVGIGFGTNGTIANPFVSVAPVNLATGDPINVNLYYMKGLMQVTLTNTTAATIFRTNFLIADFGAVLGTSIGYVGFTGSTGGSVASQQVSNFTFVPAAPPVLAIAYPGGGNSTLSWSGGVLTNMVLQQSSNLTGPWINVGTTPTLVGNNYQVLIPPAGGTQFFRLSSQ